MIVSKNQLIDNIVTEINDNSTGQISPVDIRHNLIDIIDSVHLLLDGTKNITINNLVANNFSTPNVRSVRAGIDSLSKLNKSGYTSVDNSAFGYSSLHANYQGSGNTAIGSYSLSCNIYGDNNTAIGYNSLTGNTTGVGNVGVGNYSLSKNKTGNFNIAIGHGAGYYVTSATTNKLFIASHAVNNQYICDNPLGSGLTPLVYGDLSSNNLVFGIGTRTLHDNSYGILQTSGSISPTLSSNFNLGHNNYKWKNLYLSNSILFDNTSIVSNNNSILVSGNILPFSHNTYTLGTVLNRWNDLFLEKLHVSGQAFINSLSAMQQAHYLTKTIHLASSGTFDTIDGGSVSGIEFGVLFDPEIDHPQGYLTDDNLANAGFIVRASGADGNYRQYELLFQPSGNGLTSCLEEDTIFSRSSWNSNISLHLASGCHIKAPRILNSGHIAMATYDNCYGLFIDSGNAFLSKDNVLHQHPGMTETILAGVGNINLFANSGSNDNYFVTIAAPESGVTIGQRLLTGIKVKQSGANGQDKLQGFEFKYIDDSNISYSGPKSDRLVFSSFDNTSTPINNIILLKNSQEGGVFGINNFDDAGTSLIPNTIFNVRSKNSAEARITAENVGSVSSALQLLATSNCKEDGFEIIYKNISGIADFNIYKDSGAITSLHIDSFGKVGLLSSGSLNDYLTIGDIGHSSPSISMYESTSNPSSTDKYGKLFVKQKISLGQASTIKFIDASGNLFDIILNKYNPEDGLIFTDNYYNTFGGLSSVNNRATFSGSSSIGNTAYGFRALQFVNGGIYNVAIGSYCAPNITTGDRNTVVGSNAGTNIGAGSNNILMGYNADVDSNKNNCIIIGVNVTSSESNQLKIGPDSNSIILSGIMGGASPYLTCSKGTQLNIENSSKTNYLNFTHNNIRLIDNGGTDYPTDSLVFTFAGNDSAKVFEINHAANPMDITPTFANPSTSRPYASLSGDLKLLGAIRFSDATSLDSYKPISNLESSGILLSTSGNLLASSGNILKTRLDTLFYEGHMIEDISNPISFYAPTSGLMRITNYNSEITSENYLYVSNRDKYLSLKNGDYVMVTKMPNNEYRPFWVSNEDLACNTCCK